MKSATAFRALALVLPLLFGCTPGNRPITYAYSEWSAPENLGAVVNTKSSDQHPAISPDGLSLYFHSDRPGKIDGSVAGTSDLWATHRDTPNSPWGTPVNLGPTLNSIYNDTAPTFSPDGQDLYFGSERPGGCGGSDIWVSHRSDTTADTGPGGWETPTNMGCTINSAVFDDGPTFFIDPNTGKATLYFCSQNRTGGIGDWDIMRSERSPNGTWSDPAFVTELNSTGRDTRTSIRYDGLEMLLTSRRTASVADANGLPTLDLWVATREKRQDAWGTPVNLGSAINTAANDGAPSLSQDGTEMFLYSNRPGGFGGNDLFVAHRTRTVVFPPKH